LLLVQAKLKEKEARIIIPTNLDNPPESHEIEAAWIIARHYNCVVKFLKPIIGYKVKTADFVIQGVLWELKSPTSTSRRKCVSRQLANALEQSNSIIFDGRRTKLKDVFLEDQLRAELKKKRSIRKLIFITKNQEIIVLK